MSHRLSAPAPVADDGPGERQARLLAWFETSRRDLPWRRSRDPWAVLVSELMLQQTQVARVEPKYVAFLERFPDVGSCAAADLAEVVTLWAGLGYNRRARNLHLCAAVVVERHGGTFPDDLDALLALPGVGPYTARAVLAFAFERDVGVIDANAARVLARWQARPLKRREAQDLADAAVPPGQGWSWNQAMLDLGATVCTARSPSCASCAVAATCGWARDGLPEPDPSVGTFGVSGPQSRFADSDRQGRGRLVDALRSGPVTGADLAAAMGWPADLERAERVAATLVADGLVRRADDGVWQLA